MRSGRRWRRRACRGAPYLSPSCRRSRSSKLARVDCRCGWVWQTLLLSVHVFAAEKDVQKRRVATNLHVPTGPSACAGIHEARQAAPVSSSDGVAQTRVQKRHAAPSRPRVVPSTCRARIGGPVRASVCGRNGREMHWPVDRCIISGTLLVWRTCHRRTGSQACA